MAGVALALWLGVARGAAGGPLAEGFYIHDPERLMAEHRKADLHVRAAALHRARGAAPVMLAASRCPDVEAVRADWALAPEEVLIVVCSAQGAARVAAGAPGRSGIDRAAQRSLADAAEAALASDGIEAAFEAALLGLEGTATAAPPGPPRRAQAQDFALAALAAGLAAMIRVLSGWRAFDRADPQR
ncbi:MAG: hypothetical protein H6739_35600 [Alphaproteobacteria bacterium]|nr:hypothetical protein [Alphaproteobacteria bacterium]